MGYRLPGRIEINSFHRALDWRWQRAVYLDAHGKRLSIRLDDAETNEIARYLNWRSRPPVSLSGSVRVVTRWKGIAGALRIAESGGSQRTMIEACILSGMTDEEIARRLGLVAECVRWFEIAHFNVRDRRQCPHWIYSRVIGTNPITMRMSDDDQLLKFFAYTGGPLGLDIGHATIHGLPFPPSIDELFAGTDKESESKARRKTALLIRALRGPCDDEFETLVREYNEACRFHNPRTVAKPSTPVEAA